MRTDSRAGIWRGAILVLVGMAGLISLSGLGETQEPVGETKDWTQWTENDCDALSSSASPWGYSHSYSYDLPNGQPRGYGNTAELRSALPMRQLIQRRLQLEKHYDKMDADRKQAFDQEHSHDLDPIDQVRILLINWRNDGMNPDPARQAVLRLSDGTLIQPTETNQVNYSSGAVGLSQNQFEYVFPRTIGGGPLYSLSDSTLRIELGARLVVDKKSHQAKQQPFQDSGLGFSFTIASLMYKGKLEY